MKSRKSTERQKWRSIKSTERPVYTHRAYLKEKYDQIYPYQSRTSIKSTYGCDHSLGAGREADTGVVTYCLRPLFEIPAMTSSNQSSSQQTPPTRNSLLA